MANIEIKRKLEGGGEHTSIHPEESLRHFQQVYKGDLIDYYLVDDNGHRIDSVVPKQNIDPRAKAFEAMKEKAKKLGIKGYHLMGEDKLLKAIQDAHKKAETKTA